MALFHIQSVKGNISPQAVLLGLCGHLACQGLSKTHTYACDCVELIFGVPKHRGDRLQTGMALPFRQVTLPTRFVSVFKPDHEDASVPCGINVAQ